MARTDTDTQRHEAYLAYMRKYNREYRAKNPDKCKRWRDAYILRRAARLQAEAEARGGADCGGN